MKKNWLLTVVNIVLVIILAYQNNTSTARAQAGAPSEILRLVNQVRTGYGLPPFVWEGTLAAAAQNQANYMAANNIYSHTGAGGSSPNSRAQAAGYPGRATENIVGGTDLTPNQGVIWWQNSPTHFNTMISDRYIHAGVGFAQGHGQNFFALVVGVPSGQSSDSYDAPVLADDALGAVAPIILAEPGEGGGITHVVGAGQSFWAIAARYEIPLDQLYLFNNLVEDSVINPGDKLIIRLAEGQEPPPTPTPPATHLVSQGESLWTIAAWYKLSLEEILWLNSMVEDSLVQPGDEVRIRLLPGELPPPTATVQTMHTVQSGDTAWGISNQHGLTLEQLLAFNSLTENSVLGIGDQLLIIAPSPTPTETPLATATLAPSTTPIPTTLPENTETPSPLVPLESIQNTATPASENTDSSSTLFTPGSGTSLLAAGALLLGLGVIAISIMRK